MKIKLNDYSAFLDEMAKDNDDGLIREKIIRTSVLVGQNQSDNSYYIYLAYRRILFPDDPKSDEIIECQIFMGTAIFRNKGTIDEISEKIKSKMKLIEEDFITLKLQKRNGTINL